jgi:hypothetical protein
MEKSEVLFKVNQEEIMKESVLQDWFVKKANAIEIGNYIDNFSDLEQRLDDLNKFQRNTQQVERLGLKHTREICHVLYEGKYLLQNRSVAPDGYNQMRPDLVLVSSSANYVLIELKTNFSAERQAIQELLAYSTAIKLQQPYVNNFMYVIVAQDWAPLLRHSVQALILDGKHVLPLQWSEPENGEFSLHILLGLFQFDVHQPYDPYQAMVPHTLAIAERPRYSGSIISSNAWRYFMFLRNRIVKDCEHLLQSGFLLSWRNHTGYNSQISNLTVVTVNQNWLHSEHTYGDPSMFLPEQQLQFERLMRDVATTNAAASVATMHSSNLPIKNDIFASSMYYSDVADHYPSSALSFDLLQRHRDRLVEKRIENQNFIEGSFEDGSIQNLEVFLNYLQREWSYGLQICFFTPFGELADFCKANKIIISNIDELVTILHNFRERKRSR